MTKPKWRPREQRKKKDKTFTLDPIDHEIIEWLSEFLGVSDSEVVRTSVRSFAGQMAELERKRGRRPKADSDIVLKLNLEEGGEKLE